MTLVSDLDIYRSAKLLIDQHGDEAPIHAAMRADAFLDQGNLDGERLWMRIMQAIEGLRRVRPRAGEVAY